MAVDLLRSCYSTKMRFWNNDPTEVDVRWFFCVDDAKILPFSTPFGSGNWASDRLTWPGVGEVLGADRPWVDGSQPVFTGVATPAFKGLKFAGPEEVFVNGATWPSPAIGGQFDGACLSCGPNCGLLEWLFQANDGATWTLLDTNTIRIDVQDSVNCGGSNATVQTGRACRLFSVAVDTRLIIDVNGKNEAENQGFDQYRCFVNDTQVIFIDSTEEGLGCAMQTRSAHFEVVLTAGRLHRVEVNFSTVDAAWHQGCFFKTVCSFV